MFVLVCILYGLSSFAIVLTRTSELVVLLLWYFDVFFYSKCPIAFPHGARGSVCSL